jgi:predicted NUDIX family phosphoesterase
MKPEKILVISRSHMEKILGNFQGFLKASPNQVEALFEESALSFTERKPAETNPNLKQIIPYCVLSHQGKFLRYERGQSGGEHRLRTKKSIGIGGHINPIDTKHNQKTYENALERELQEEIEYEKILSRKTLGFLNDDSNPVGEVHLGIVEILELSSPNISPKEDAIQNPELLSLQRILEDKDSLENWSQLTLQALEKE